MERANALAEAEQTRAQAKTEIAAMLEEAQQEEARRAAELEAERAALRAEAEQSKADAYAEAERIKAEAHAEAERVKLEARQEADAQIEEAKRHSEEMSMYAAAAHSAHEERLQALSEECDEVVGRARRALETQLSLLPPVSAVTARSPLQEALSAATRGEQKNGSAYTPVRGERLEEGSWHNETTVGGGRARSIS